MYQCRPVSEFSWYLASGTLRLVYSGLVFQTFTRVFRKKIDNELKMSFLSWEFNRISKPSIDSKSMFCIESLLKLLDVEKRSLSNRNCLYVR